MPKHNYLTELLGDDSTPTSVGDKLVPNLHPKIKNVPYRIAIVGETPGADEVTEGRPFVGFSGRSLDSFLSKFGILRDAVFIGNVCQHRPYKNQIAQFDWDGPEIQNGIDKLTDDLRLFTPNVVICLGGTALHLFKVGRSGTLKKKKSKDGLSFIFPNSISDWRGSFFEATPDSPLMGVKCIASFHPAACLRQFEWTPLLMMDIQRAFTESTTKTLLYPERKLLTGLTFDETIAEMEKVIKAEKPIGTDIEGYWNNWSCISFATAPDYSFIVPLTTKSGESYWTLDEEITILDYVTAILSNPRIPKVWQNGLYDRFCTQYGYGIVTRGPSHDIMLKHWELYCELEKALSVQCSIYTKEPYYKAERGTQDLTTFHRYCCKDSAVTLEIDQKLSKYLTPPSQKHYAFNLTLLNALLYMEIRGIRYNAAGAVERLATVEHQIYDLQHRLNKVAGRGLATLDRVLLRSQLRDFMCYKNDPSRVKKGFEEDFDICMRTLLGEGPLTDSDKGRLETALGISLNTKGKQLPTYLYETLGLPVQKDPKTDSVTCDYEALLTLKKRSAHPSLPLIIDIGELRTRAQMLAIKSDPDGRVRSSYNEVGADTGRVTSSTSPTGSGYNLQTIPDENELKPIGHPLREGMRDLLEADVDCLFGKCDLRGADGWTVGANLAALGDRTMLDDLLFGLKPASILCYARRHGVNTVIGKSREELAYLCGEVKKHDWDYFAYKQTIWGFCYLMGVRKAVQHVYNLSEGEVTVPEHEMQLAKDLAFRRWNLPLWHNAVQRKLSSQPYPPKLTSPSGHVRMFFGRRQETLGQALAHEPQSVTTYATNSAMHRLWTDPENRVYTNGICRLRIEPMHQVHDEVLLQFRRTDTEWALSKIRSWFSNPISIAGITITIPFEGAYGTNWAMDASSKLGSI